MAIAAIGVSLVTWYFGVHQDARKEHEKALRVYSGSFTLGQIWGDVQQHARWDIDPRNKDSVRDKAALAIMRDIVPIAKAMGIDFDIARFGYSDIRSPDGGNNVLYNEQTVGKLLADSLQLYYNDRLASTAFLLGEELAEMCGPPNDAEFAEGFYSTTSPQVPVPHEEMVRERLDEIHSTCSPLPPWTSDPRPLREAATMLHDCLQQEWTVTAQRPWNERLAESLSRLRVRRSAGSKSYSNWCRDHQKAFNDASAAIRKLNET